MLSTSKGAAGSCHTAPAGTPSPSTPRLFTNNSLGVALVLASLRPLLSISGSSILLCHSSIRSPFQSSLLLLLVLPRHGTSITLTSRSHTPASTEAVCGSRPHRPSAQESRSAQLCSFLRRGDAGDEKQGRVKLALHKTAVEPHRQSSFSVSYLRGAKHLPLHVYCYCLIQRHPSHLSQTRRRLARIYTRRHKLAEIGAPEHRHRP